MNDTKHQDLTSSAFTLSDKSLEPVKSLGSKFVRYFGIIVVLLSVILLIGLFLILPKQNSIELPPEVWTAIWVIGIILVLLIIALVLTEIVLLIRARAQKQAGSRLQSRMVAIFALTAAVPAIIVAIVAAIVLNQGLDQWFSERTRTMVESSRLVARAYLQEHSQVMRDDIIWVASELEQAKETFATDRDKFQRILTALALTRSLPFTSLISKDRDVLMRAQISVPGTPPLMPDGIMQDVKKTIPTLISPGKTNLVGSVIQLSNYDDVYLFAARPVDAEVLEYMRLTDQNITEYRQYDSARLVFQLTFTIIYIGVALVMLLAAVWVGIAFANRFIAPIRDLMIASDRVTHGDLEVQIAESDKQSDLNDLIQQFNLMTRQLREQRQELLLANDTNEKRRQFTEAVVEGVSAGIVGLDPSGIITLVNNNASEIFARSEINLVGEELGKVVPELALFFEKASASRSGQFQDQIQFGGEHDGRIYQVRLTREGAISHSKGFVITLDDLTDLMTAQRTSAWADVARRIAHEIKNPLTPIQLSAERLKRRYKERLSDDFEIFDKCIETIIRQVGDIGRMVDEFSSFARMPVAVLERSDLSETIRQAVFLESVRQPDILIKANLPKEPNIVEFDDRLISQCLTNLIKNCVESIEGFGIGKIIDPTIIIETKISGQYVEISISDNGKGWPDESHQRLLEPYVTTRDKGTGLGLAIVSKIIEQHDGDMILQDSVPDKHNQIGACVIIRLPLKHDVTKGELHLLSN
ncbi:MAG: PAS domain-containing sensor histidine kinase, partial [Devosiaceae bacterium]|nr:PAS domain-containing sensor histidine kinase [Devosiaceae bacterium]